MWRSSQQSVLVSCICLEYLRGNEDAITLFPERLPATAARPSRAPHNGQSSCRTAQRRRLAPRDWNAGRPFPSHRTNRPALCADRSHTIDTVSHLTIVHALSIHNSRCLNGFHHTCVCSVLQGPSSSGASSAARAATTLFASKRAVFDA